MSDIQTGLLLLAVGLVTVFAALLIVIFTGKALIALVNKFAPEEEVSPKSAQTSTSGVVSDNVKKVIAATVRELTKGKGVVSNIEKR